LGKLIGKVKSTAIQFAETAGRVALVSNMTSEGVRSQKEETTHASEAVKLMAGSLHESVEGSKNAVTIAENIKGQANASKTVVSQAINTIHTLAEEVKNAAEVIQALEKESQDISSVTSIIADITKQTNLLALNAAIEAARAGEQGRGFAVVADEVRKLALRTHSATQDIQKKIEILQTGAKEATQVMIKGRNQADESVAQINKTNEALENIIRSITTIHTMNSQISGSVGEQSLMATRINETIMNVSSVAEQTAYSSSNTTTEIEKIAEAALNLSQLVAKFTVPSDASRNVSSVAPSNAGSAADDYLF
jgi:methyl-accepting chemotaxis protein